MNIKEFVKTKKFKTVLIFLGLIFSTLIVFELGVCFGFKKAERSMRWGNNYHKIIGQQKNDMMGQMRGERFMNPDGSSGEVIKIDLPSVFVGDKEGVEKEVVIATSTIIRKFKNNIKGEDIKEGNFLIVVGRSNNDGSVEAKLIRVMDEKPDFPDFNLGIKLFKK